MGKFVYIEGLVSEDFHNSPFYQKLCQVCSLAPSEDRRAVVVHSPNEKKILNYLLETKLDFFVGNPKDAKDGTFLTRDIRNLHNKTGNNKVEFGKLGIKTVFIIDPLASISPEQLEPIFNIATDIHYFTTELAFKKLLINEFNNEDSFFFNIPMFASPANVANSALITKGHDAFWKLLGSNNIFKQTFYEPANYLFYAPERPLKLFNGMKKELEEVDEKLIILTDSEAVSSKTLDSISNLKSNLHKKDEDNKIELVLSQIKEYNETLQITFFEKIEQMSQQIEKLHSSNDQITKMIEESALRPTLDAVEQYEVIEEDDPLKAFRK